MLKNTVSRKIVLIVVLFFCLVVLRVIAGAGDDFGSFTLKDLKEESVSTFSKIAHLVNPINFKSNITSLFTTTPTPLEVKISEEQKLTLFNNNQSGITGSESCLSGNDECFLLNQSRGELDIQIFNTSGGQTFTAYSGTLPLRQDYSGEAFFVDKSGGNLQINYSILEKPGGVDIVYTLFNPTLEKQKIPEFRIEGIRHLTTGTLNRLSPLSGNLLTMYTDNSLGSQFNNQYPGNYSPVMLMHDENFASGVSLMYPYLNFKHNTDLQLSRLTGGQQDGTWRYRYHNMKDDKGEDATVAPFEYRQYTLSQRFSSPEHWILTLHPYREYFLKLYKGFGGTLADRDLRPICGRNLTSQGVSCSPPDSEINPRGYNYNTGIHETGWQPFIDNFINVLKDKGYERTMFWNAAGRYCTPHNYPMQFMNFLPELERGSFNFHRLAGEGMSLGFWWGRSGEIAIKSGQVDIHGWDPTDRESADLTNINHLRFLVTQLIKAKNRGVNEIGLDHITPMPAYQRYPWVAIMQRLAPGVNFLHENSGSDFMHSKIGNYLNLHLVNPTAKVEGPDVLSWYLNNGGSEIWVNPSASGSQMNGDFETFQKLVSWGFTPVNMYSTSGSCLDVSNINYNLTPCFDGKAPDWPYDCECKTATANPDPASCY